MITPDTDFIMKTAVEILAVDSPTGICRKAVEKVQEIAESMGFSCSKSVKGNLFIDIPGQSDAKTVGICAHVDTLGLMVRSVKPSGNLAFSRIGGVLLPTIDGEYCKVITRDGRVYSGTILSVSPAVHVFEDAATLDRTEKNMEIKLDMVVKSREDVEALGICAGDFVFIDTKTVVTDSGFIKSRFLDDKFSVAILMGVLKYLKDNNVTPLYDTKMLISTYEETGHGMAYIPEGISEILAVDMGCIGDDLSCSETDVSICAMDTSGPYDYDMTTKLIGLAKEEGLSYAVDIYPRYSSDASAALKGGNDLRTALIGPGVSASHGMERGHKTGAENAAKLVVLYLTKP